MSTLDTTTPVPAPTTKVSSPLGVNVISTSASPMGQPRARSLSDRGGSLSSTSVLSLIIAGHTPNEWWS